jgi:type I restriction enzyme S subunit
MVTLEELIATRQGSVNPASFADETFELYSIPAFDSRKPEILKGRDIGSTKQVVQPRDVLLSKIVPHIRRSWIVGPAENYRQIASGEWIVFRSARVVPEYLRHALLCDDFHAQFMQTVSGVGGSLLRARPAQVAKIRVPLPSLPEQRRIAAILDKADALCAKRREALAQLDHLAQSIFVEMFGDPIANDRNWPAAKVSDFVAGFESGKSLVADDEDEITAEFRVLKISAVTSLEYRPEQSKAVPADYAPPTSHFVRNGDLLFSRANTTDLIGATALVRNTPDNLLLPDKLWRFVWFDEPRASVLYVRQLFQQPKFRLEVGKRASGSSGSMQNISQPKVLSIPVGLPPLGMQCEFSKRVAEIDALKRHHQQTLNALDNLFASLQHRAFRGEL